MNPFKHHILVCTQDKPDGVPACSRCGGKELLDQLRARLIEAKLADDVLLTPCGCLGLCERGPNIVIYPEGVWHTSVKASELDTILASLASSTPVKRDDPDDATIRRELSAHRAKVAGMMAARAKAGVLPDELNALVRGFMPSRAVLTAVELDIFSVVGEGATHEQVTERLGADLRGTRGLLDALVSLGLLVRKGSQVANGALAATFLTASSPHDSRAALMHSVHMWQRWSSLTACVRTGRPAVEGPGGQGDAMWTNAFIAAMHKNGTLRAPAVAAAIDLNDVRTLLDVGGGSGAYSIAFARAAAALEPTIFDLPSVVPLARKYVAEAGLAERVRLVEGDFRTDELGEGFDLVLVSAICHMNSPEHNQQMLAKCARALRPGGRAVVQDYILGDDGSGHAMATLFSLNMLVGTSGGASYRGKDYLAWLGGCGLVDAAVVTLPGPTGLVIARRP